MKSGLALLLIVLMAGGCASRTRQLTIAPQSYGGGVAGTRYIDASGDAMDYATAVRTIFREAWRVDDLSGAPPAVTAVVTVLRDGSISSRRITKSSGTAAVDASVQRALGSVTRVPAFPEGAKGGSRDIEIVFERKK